MKQWKRNWALLLLTIWTALLLSACGKEAAVTDAMTTEAAATATATMASTAADATAADAAAIDGAAANYAVTDYAKAENWAYLETNTEGKAADVFFICPSVYGGSEEACNMSLDDAKVKESFVGAINMEKGIYEQNSRFFAPYYQQIGLNVYEMEPAEREPYLDIAYADVKAAFEYYEQIYNEGRPIILAGFSQGADLCIRLMKDCFDEEALQKQLVACYAIGWHVTEDEVKQHPQLRMAEGETDTGVIISFNSEAETISDSLLIPAGTKTFAINPLNWKTDGTVADKSLNKGACFTDYSGAIKKEIPQLTGAYIDETRGALKVPDVSPADYPAGLSIFEDGVYHLYDYQFFYRNLQENVQKRLTAFLEAA